MRILDKMVAKSFFKLFALAITATPPLFILADVTESLDRYLDRGLTGTQVAQAYLWQLPLYVQWSFPIAALIGAVFTVHNMTQHREVVAAKAGGVSFHRLARPMLVAGVFLTVVALGLSEVVPRAFRRANAILQNDGTRAWRADFVYQTEDGVSLAADRLTLMDGRMEGLVVVEKGLDGAPRLHVDAARAAYAEPDGWTLYDGTLRVIEGPDSVRSHEFARLRMPRLQETPTDLLEEPRGVEEMTYAELGRLATITERSGGQPNQLRVTREQKISIPVATLVIILFGMPLATSPNRGGTAYGVGVSLGTTMLYLLCFKVAGGFGAGATIPPGLAAWLPNIVFLAAALVLMRKVRT